MDTDLVVMMGNQPRDFADLRVGDWVTVNFHQESGGPALADSIAITAPPAPYAGETAQGFSVPGKVVAIDRGAGTFTIDPSSCNGVNHAGRRELLTFTLDRRTVVMMGDEQKGFRDVNVGDWVTVNYHQENNGLVTTDEVAFTSAAATCPERQG